MSDRMGFECKTFYGAAGSTAGTELTNIKDLTLGVEAGEADTTTRAANGWKSSRPTLFTGDIQFDMKYDTADPGFNFIQAAFFSRTPVALALLDGAGGHGLDADFSVMKFERKEPLEEAVTVSVSMKPNAALRAPQWV